MHLHAPTIDAYRRRSIAARHSRNSASRAACRCNRSSVSHTRRQRYVSASAASQTCTAAVRASSNSHCGDSFAATRMRPVASSSASDAARLSSTRSCPSACLAHWKRALGVRSPRSCAPGAASNCPTHDLVARYGVQTTDVLLYVAPRYSPGSVRTGCTHC